MQSNQIEVLTGGGSAAVGVLRITGPACLAFLQSNFSRRVVAGRCVHGELRDGDEVIDDVVIALDQDNQRAEICTHGSPWIVDRVQRLGAKWGFEFHKNNPQLDPIDETGTERDALERDVAAWMPVARTELGVRMLGAQLEAWEPILQRKCQTDQLAAISNDQTLWRLLHPPTLAIVGRPNAGKSTLANRLFQRDRSIVADLPGTTRDWVGDYADINGLPVLLLDTPGIRATSDVIESEAIRLAENQIATADLIIWLRDGREVRETLPISHGRVLRVRNKCDLPLGLEKEPEEIDISAINGDGLDHLKVAILRTFGCFNLAIPLPRWWTPRQQKWLRQIH